MRPTIVLLSDVDTHRELVDRLRHVGSYSEGEFFDRLEQETCSFGVDLSGDVIAEFEEEEVAEIHQELGEFSAILIEYPDMPCVRRLLPGLIQGLDGLLDTNHGELLRYDRVLERFRLDPFWDWRDHGPDKTQGTGNGT
ncbi:MULTISPECIES: hypothetical protein [Streptosporangium]|uniref:Barstar (barnase inhibitor) domain-containing protein n=1 Tax=Streptosporangium brasiliense TaxID=47480 RepID=A0ABT9R0A2_9ACTN|nr:hypothetical protein [Streptosporangium brasiliense]MDP9862646.1 hypothetical protein [Streptosporangium brasiliense]